MQKSGSLFWMNAFDVMIVEMNLVFTFYKIITRPEGFLVFYPSWHTTTQVTLHTRRKIRRILLTNDDAHVLSQRNSRKNGKISGKLS